MKEVKVSAEDMKNLIIEFVSNYDDDNLQAIQMTYGFVKRLYFIQQDRKVGVSHE